MLRPYQKQAVEEIRRHFKAGHKKVLLHLATGGGKTSVFCSILKAMHKNGKSAIMVVRGRKLVDQASKRLDREDVPHGVLMANHPRYQPSESIQVCSIDTVHARGLKPKADLIVIDECHQATSASYLSFLSQYGQDETRLIAVTATPYAKKGLRHVADVVVYPITLSQLVEQSFLVPPVYYSLPPPDLTGVAVQGGDYVINQLSERCDTITGDVVSTWKTKGEDRPTLCFAVDIRHSRSIVHAFNQRGVPARHVDADTTDWERDQAIKDLESGKIKVLSNVGIMCTGVDIPFASCLIMARPTKSYGLYVQQAGRGTRICPERKKKDFILLDHGGNVPRHGFIENERPAILDPETQGMSTKELVPPVSTCKKCYATFGPSTKTCPRCGEENADSLKEIIEIKGELVLLTRDQAKESRTEQRVNELKEIRRKNKYKRGWLWHRLKVEFNEHIANKYCPKRNIPEFVRKKLK